MHGRARLTDVAEQAGVSTATVSRVLNGRAGVAEPTRRAVLAALDMLGYERPDRLRTRSNGLVGLLVPELTTPVFPAFAQALESQLVTHGYTPLLCTPGGTTEDQHVELLLEHAVDGIVVVSGLPADVRADVERYQRLRGQGLPIALINGHNPRIDAPSFSTDDRAAMDSAVRHLASQGHRTVGLAIGPERFVPALRKREGFARAMTAHLGSDDAPWVTTLDTVEGGLAAGAALLDDGCTAVVCASDLMALGVVRAARSRGLQVPRDVSVVGFDDSTLVAFTDPPLTTVRQPVEAIAQAAVATLVAEMTGNGVARSELLFVPELIVRGSTAAAPGPPTPRAADAGPPAAADHVSPTALTGAPA